jgi:hypothetical protein
MPKSLRVGVINYFFMKKHLLLLTLLIGNVFIVLSIHPLRQVITNNTSLEVQRTIYRTYTPEQKLIIWTDKLNQTLQYGGGWNNEQYDFIIMVRNHLNELVFTDNSIQQANFITFYHNIQSNGINLFGLTTFGKIFGLLNDYDNNAPVGTEGNNDCECCSTCTFTCEWWNGQSCDKSNKCVSDTRGCGFLFNQKCDGKCDIGILPPQQ